MRDGRSCDVMLLDLPLPVRFVTPGGIVETTFPIKAESEDFPIPFPAAPDLVRIDPGLTVLARVTFNVPDAILHRQLRATNDAIGRLRTVEALVKKQDKTSIERRREALSSGTSHAIRPEPTSRRRTGI